LLSPKSSFLILAFDTPPALKKFAPTPDMETMGGEPRQI